MGSDGYTVMHRDDFERAGRWGLARRSLGIASFGANVVDMEPGYTLPEHDETRRDQEELFVVLSGSTTVVIEGEEHAAPAGTYVRVAPELKRTVRNDGPEPASVLIVSAPSTSGYEPMEWA